MMLHESAQPKGDAARFVLTASMTSHCGHVRKQNEDVVSYILSADGDGTPDHRLLALVADGIGGALAGEVASRIAADTVLRLYNELKGSRPEVLQACMLAANSAILERGRSDPACRGMGTTCTVLALADGVAYLAHIGDSRAYLLRNGVLSQISEDHSLVAEMVRNGTLTLEEAARSPRRNALLRALGAAELVEPLVFREGLPLRDADRFVLCSDGLTDVVDDEEIRNIAALLAPSEACKELVGAALAAGGPDNISVGVFAVDAMMSI